MIMKPAGRALLILLSCLLLTVAAAPASFAGPNPSFHVGLTDVNGNNLLLSGGTMPVSGTVTTVPSGTQTVAGNGTAGTPAAGVLSVQGIGGGTALPVAGTGTAGTPAANVLSVQGIGGGTAIQVQGVNAGTSIPVIVGAATAANILDGQTATSGATILTIPANRVWVGTICAQAEQVTPAGATSGSTGDIGIKTAGTTVTPAAGFLTDVQTQCPAATAAGPGIGCGMVSQCIAGVTVVAGTSSATLTCSANISVPSSFSCTAIGSLQ